MTDDNQLTYNEKFFDMLDKAGQKKVSWREESRTGKAYNDKTINRITEETVRDAMFSFGKEALARHIDAGGYISPMLRDYLSRNLRGERDLLPRGNKRTDAQEQKEIGLVFKIFSAIIRDNCSQYAAISQLMDKDATLNRKRLEELVAKAKRRPRWGIHGLYSSVMEGRANELAIKINECIHNPYNPPVFAGKVLGYFHVTFGEFK